MAAIYELFPFAGYNRGKATIDMEAVRQCMLDMKAAQRPMPTTQTTQSLRHECSTVSAPGNASGR